MASRHDNSRPASGGTISISHHGTFTYLPIEHGKALKPLMALFLHEQTDGTLKASLDIRFVGCLGEMDQEDEE